METATWGQILSIEKLSLEAVHGWGGSGAGSPATVKELHGLEGEQRVRPSTVGGALESVHGVQAAPKRWVRAPLEKGGLHSHGALERYLEDREALEGHGRAGPRARRPASSPVRSSGVHSAHAARGRKPKGVLKKPPSPR